MPAEEGRLYSVHWRVEKQHGLITLSLGGELDLGSVDTIAEVTARLGAEAPVLVVDLAELEFMDSTGLRLLAKSKKEADAEGRRFLIARLSPAARRVIHIAGLIDYFDYVEGMPPDEKLCPSCDSWVPADTVRCIHCGAAF